MNETIVYYYCDVYVVVWWSEWVHIAGPTPGCEQMWVIVGAAENNQIERYIYINVRIARHQI